MKQGEKVYCKKMYIHGGKIVFKKNKFYTIFLLDESIESPCVWLYCENKSMPNDYCGFIINGQLYSDFDYFSEYFINDIKELRKIKLTELKK